WLYRLPDRRGFRPVFAVESERGASISVHCIARGSSLCIFIPSPWRKTYGAGAARMRPDSGRAVSGNPLPELDLVLFCDEPVQSGASARPLGGNCLLRRGGEAAICGRSHSLGTAAASGRHCGAAGPEI